MLRPQGAIKLLLDAGEGDVGAVSQIDTLEAVIKLWAQLEKRNQEFAKMPSTQAEVELHNTQLIEAQDRLMSIAASIQSQNEKHLAFKLALWRWDAPELDVKKRSIQRSDRVAYSAFIDLVRLTGLDTLLRPQDIPFKNGDGQIL